MKARDEHADRSRGVLFATKASGGEEGTARPAEAEYDGGAAETAVSLACRSPNYTSGLHDSESTGPESAFKSNVPYASAGFPRWREPLPRRTTVSSSSAWRCDSNLPHSSSALAVGRTRLNGKRAGP